MKQMFLVVLLFLLGLLDVELAAVSELWTAVVMVVFVVVLVVYPCVAHPNRLGDATSLATNFVFATTSVCSVCVMQDVNVLNLMMFVYALADTATWISQQIRKGFVWSGDMRTPTKAFVCQVALLYVLLAQMMYVCFNDVAFPWYAGMTVFVTVAAVVLTAIVSSQRKYDGEVRKEFGFGIKDIIAMVLLYVGDGYIFGCNIFTVIPTHALVCLLLIVVNGLVVARQERGGKCCRIKSKRHKE